MHPNPGTTGPVDLLAGHRDRWHIEQQTLGVWSAVRKSPDGRHIRVIIGPSAAELAGKLETADMGRAMTSLETIHAAHPGWTIRRDAGQDWTAYTAQRVQVLVAPTLAELAAKLDRAGSPAGIASDPRVTRARELAAEHHQPITMTPGDVRHLLSRWQRAATELMDVLTEIRGS